MRPGNEASVTLVKTATKTGNSQSGALARGKFPEGARAETTRHLGGRKEKLGLRKDSQPVSSRAWRDPWRESAAKCLLLQTGQPGLRRAAEQVSEGSKS